MRSSTAVLHVQGGADREQGGGEGSTAFSCDVSPGDEARAGCEALLPVTRDNGRRRPLDVLLLLLSRHILGHLETRELKFRKVSL